MLQIFKNLKKHIEKYVKLRYYYVWAEMIQMKGRNIF